VIQTLKIERFKSIRSLAIPCRKVNVFIGAPDTGKTNILDSLQLASCLGWSIGMGHWLRLRGNFGFDALFYHQFFDQPLAISFDDTVLTADIQGQERRLQVRLRGKSEREQEIQFGQAVNWPELRWIRFYTYVSSMNWTYATGGPDADKLVSPPQGENLLYISRHNTKVYERLKQSVAELSWKLKFDQNQKLFLFSEVREDEILDYNLDLLSDSLKRLFFYTAILVTSENATIVLDEPDVYAFPPYPKSLGEMIGTDTTNQFFVTTHNPYFLAGLIQKTPEDKLGIFVCHRDSEGGTCTKLLSPAEVQTVIEQGASVFFNLDSFTGP